MLDSEYVKGLYAEREQYAADKDRVEQIDAEIARFEPRVERAVKRPRAEKRG